MTINKKLIIIIFIFWQTNIIKNTKRIQNEASKRYKNLSEKEKKSVSVFVNVLEVFLRRKPRS